ncbi:MAG: F0F1 ATP synthase subunit A [Verrucomicrobiales bacterium]|nr:F0F1 ATP synthase subunit A [Verrucomicrobiales bacterium]
MPPFVLAVTRHAESIFGEEMGMLSFLTNSSVVALLVLGIVMFIARKATSNMTLVPNKWQNGFEALVEFLYDKVSDLVGPKVAPKAFPLLATLFVFILVSNYFGLLPGVGTIGFGHGNGFLSLEHVDRPLLRPATADLNMTLGLAACAMILWLVITIREVGVWGFVVHTFGPKGGLKGFVGMMVALVFLFVGVLEIVSIAIRPVTLSLRLFGNVFAGETVLHTMSGMGGFIGSVLAPLPFYFMELLVGLLQAIVFTMLCAVYIQLSTAHDEEHGHDEAGHDAH